jgi:hypothetical protein
MTCRSGFKWNVNECLRLQREYELLGLSIDEIASLHGRSPLSIMYKLDAEGFDDFNTLYSNYNKLNGHIATKQEQPTLDNDDNDNNDESQSTISSIEDEDDSYDIDSIKNHVSRLEKQIINLTELITKNKSSMFSIFS